MITLAEAKVGMTNKVDQQVIETFQRSSLLLDKLIFDNSISPGTGGSTLGYTYIQQKSPSTAGVRDINSEYTPTVAKREEKSTKAIIMGGSFTIDRVIAETDGAVDEVAYQMEEKVKATSNEFHNMVINGDTAKKEFDGLKKLLSGTDTEVSTTLDLSDSAKTTSNAQEALDTIDSFLSVIDGTPTMLLMNKQMKNKLRSVARRADYFEHTKDDFGRVVETYNGIPMEDAGQYWDGTNTVDVIPVNADGSSEIYAIVIGQQAFVGISPQGNKIIKQRMPDFTKAGAVKEGDVELIAGVALKNSKKAGVLKGIKIKAAETPTP